MRSTSGCAVPISASAFSISATAGRASASGWSGVIRDFAFEVLGLHRLELEVFSFNPRAQAVYRKAGFRVEGVRRDAVLDGQTYADAIEMAILEEEWRALKAL